MHTLHNAESDCATMSDRVAEAILDQGPCYIACTDSDEYLARVAEDAAKACAVPYLLALTVCRDLRGDNYTPEFLAADYARTLPEYD